MNVYGRTCINCRTDQLTIGIVFGLAPALNAARTDVNVGLRDRAVLLSGE